MRQEFLATDKSRQYISRSFLLFIFYSIILIILIIIIIIIIYDFYLTFFQILHSSPSNGIISENPFTERWITEDGGIEFFFFFFKENLVEITSLIYLYPLSIKEQVITKNMVIIIITIMYLIVKMFIVWFLQGFVFFYYSYYLIKDILCNKNQKDSLLSMDSNLLLLLKL